MSPRSARWNCGASPASGDQRWKLELNIREREPTDRPARRVEGTPSRIVGIDLGTTNSALAWTDAQRPSGHPNLRRPSARSRRRDRPSRYVAIVSLSSTDSEIAARGRQPGCRSCPGIEPRRDVVAGVFARDHGSLVPAGWWHRRNRGLSNPAVDRTAPLLPWGAEDGPRLSPVDASARLLAHIRDAWDHEFARDDERLRLTSAAGRPDGARIVRRRSA